MEVLHLMVNNICLNDCPLCCNKQYDVEEIPVVTPQDLASVDTVCLTGGEPFLAGKILPHFIDALLNQRLNIKTLYIYTSGGELGAASMKALVKLQDLGTSIGLSIGPKSTGDRNNLRFHYDAIVPFLKKLGQNRFYCFCKADRDIAEEYYQIDNMEIIDRKWQENFVPAPNTIFRRLPVWL